MYEHTHDGHSIDDRSAPCVKCGYQRKPLPTWARTGARFALEGVSYRIVSCGSSNRGPQGSAHFVDHVHAERLDTEPWHGLPIAGATKAQVAAALKQVFAMPCFRVEQLGRAMHEAA